MASFQSQYGIRLSREMHGMKWSEFAAFLNGMDGKSPLGRIVSIRAEDDPEMLKQFTPQQRRIRSKWRSQRAKQMPQQQVDAFLESMKQALIGLAGGTASEEADLS